MLVMMCLCRCCKGLFENDSCLAEHVRECDGDAFKSPAQLFACERDRFLTLVASVILPSENFEPIHDLAADDCWEPKPSSEQLPNKSSDLPEVSKLVSESLAFSHPNEPICLEAKICEHGGKGHTPDIAVEGFEEFKSGSLCGERVLENGIGIHGESEVFASVSGKAKDSCSTALGSSSELEYEEFSSDNIVIGNVQGSRLENLQQIPSAFPADQKSPGSTLLSILNMDSHGDIRITSDSCILLDSFSSVAKKPSNKIKDSLSELVNSTLNRTEAEQRKEICPALSQSAYTLLQNLAAVSSIKQQKQVPVSGESLKADFTNQGTSPTETEVLGMRLESSSQSVSKQTVGGGMNRESRTVPRQRKTTSASSGNKAKVEAMKEEILPLCTLIPMDTNSQSENKFRCNLCGYVSAHVAVMHRHLQQTHNNGAEFHCDQCNYRCKRRSKMKEHQARHSQKFLCHHCTATFVDMSSLNRHIMCKHTENSVLKCQICDFVAPHASGLTEHMRKHTGDMLLCNFKGCSYQTPYKRALRVHQKRHAADKIFSCHLCSYQTPESYCLTRHLKTHDKFRPFKCGNCSFTGITKYEVVRHMRSKHFQQKRFACDKCSFRTSYPNSIVKHLVGHMGTSANLYACPICQEQFNAMARAKKHIYRQHKRDDVDVLLLQEPVKINVADYLCIDSGPVSDATVEGKSSGIELTIDVAGEVPADVGVGAPVDPMKLSFHFSDLPPLSNNTVSITRSSSIPDLFTYSGITSSMHSSSQSDLLTFSGINITRSNSMSDLVSFASSMCAESSGPLHMDVSLSDATAPVDMPSLSLEDGTEVSLGEATGSESSGVVLAVHCSQCSALLINEDEVESHNRTCNGLVQLV